MADLTEIQSSQSVKIAGRDEVYQADVIQEDGDNKLLVKAAPASSDSPGCPVLTPKLRVTNSEAFIGITTSYVTLFSYSGSGKLIQFQMDCSSANIGVRLTIDGEVIFDELDLRLLDNWPNSLYRYSNPVIVSSGSGTLAFRPPCPVKYETSVLIEAKTFSGGTKDLDRLQVSLTQET